MSLGRITFLIITPLVFILSVFAFQVSAEPTATINYQGKLTDDTGVTVADGSYNMRFYIYNAIGGATTTAIWTEELTGGDTVQITNGLFSVMLGSTTPLTSVNFNQALYLGVEIGGIGAPSWDGEMSPRKDLGTVPAAFEAFQLGGVASSSFLRSDQDDTASGLLTFTGGLLSAASSTITNFSFGTATGTTLNINGESFTDFTGTGLTNVGGALSVSSSSLNISLEGLTDVSSMTEDLGDLLYWDGNAWADLATSSLNVALNDTTGTLSVTRGGTGVTSISSGDLLYGDGVDSIAALGAGSNGQILQLSGGLPSWAATSSLGINEDDTIVTVAASDSSVTEKVSADYIADGTNDEDEIQQAIDYVYANSGGGTVQLLAGTFNVGTTTYADRSINLATSTRLIGQGDSTILRLRDGHNLPLNIIMAENVSSAYVGSLVLDGNDANNTAGQVGFQLTNAPSVTIDGNVCKNFSSECLGAELSSGLVVSNNYLEQNSNSSNSIYIYGYGFGSDYVENVKILNNTIVGLGGSGAGISTYDVRNSIISGNHVSGFTDGTGIAMYGDSDSRYDFGNVVTGNVIDNNQYGISVGAFKYNTIANNTITNNSRQGVDVNYLATNNSITQNSLYGNGHSGAYSSIDISDPTADVNLIANNYITATGTDPLIEVSSGVQDTTIIGNVYENPDTTSYVLDNGTGTRYNEWDRTTITTDNSRGYNLLNITGSTTATATAITQLGTGDIFTLNNASSRVLTVNNSGNVGIGSSSPSSKLTIQGTAGASAFRVASSTGATDFLVNRYGDVEVTNGLYNAGISWEGQSVPSGVWNTVTYGNGRFVAVANIGTDRVMYSDDGINWATTTAAENNNWYDITYGNGLFVAVSDDGTNRVMTSPDGINWTARTAAEANQWYDITYGNGLFVAVSDDGTNRVMTSPDGINWTARAAAQANSWYNITYGNGLFVAIANSGTNRVMTSPDGINWTARTAAENNNWYDITYGNGLFVAVSYNGTNRVMTSPDGITWTARPGTLDRDWLSITYGNGLFVAVSSDGTNRVMTSPDGINWTDREGDSNIAGNGWSSVTYANGRFVTVASGAVMTSGSPTETRLAHNNIYQGGMSILGGAFNIGTTTSFGNPSINNILNIASTTGTSLLTVNQSGYLGIGASSLSSKLTVQGTAGSGDDLFSLASSTGSTLFSVDSNGNVNFQGRISASSTATSTFAQGIDIDAGCFAISGVCIGGLQALSALTDVDTTGAATGNLLSYDGAQWVDIATSSLGINEDDTIVTVAASDSPATEKAAADYIADGTNDQETINTALSALLSTGGSVHLLAGTYSINDTITIAATGTKLVGAGKGTILQMTASSTVWDMIEAENKSQIYVGHMELDGSLGSGGIMHGIKFSDAASSTIENVIIKNMQDDGIRISGSSGGFVVSNNILQSNGAGINSYSSNVLIDGNLVERSVGSGIAVWSSQVITTNNTVKNNGGRGIYYLSSADYGVIAGNIVDNNSAQGICSEGRSYLTIGNNVVSNSGNSGIWLRLGASNNTVTGNILRLNGETLASILISDTSSNNVISSNSIYATGTDALIEINNVAAEDNLIANNMYENPDTNVYISDSGTGTRYDDYNRNTLTTEDEVGYNLLSISGSTSVAMAYTTQLGTGDIFTYSNASSEVLTLTNGGFLGIGTSTPSSKLTVWSDTAGVGTRIFEIADSASTTIFAVNDMGALTSTGSFNFSSTTATSTIAGGLNVAAINQTGSASSTFANGIDLSGGCFAISGVCIGGLQALSALTDVDTTGAVTSNILSFNGSQWVDTSTSSFLMENELANSAALAALLSDETGTGNVVFSDSSTFTGTSVFNKASTTYASTTDMSLYGRLFDSSSSEGVDGYILQTTGDGVTWVSTSSLGFVAGDTKIVVATSDTDSGLSANADYVADGTADNVEIQAALDAVFAMGGGSVELLEGTYAISATVDVPTSTRLTGAGIGNTTLVLDAGVNANVINILGSTTTISHLSIDGNSAGQTAGVGIDFSISYQNSLALLEKIEIFDAYGSGVDAAYTEVYIYDSVISNNGAHGIFENVGSMVGNNIYGNSLDGIYFADSFIPGVVADNQIHDNGRAGINLQDSSRARVVGNFITDNAGDGIDGGWYDSAIISGNVVSSNDGHGIDARVGLDSSIDTNNISNNTLNGINREGGGSENFVISNNIINNNGDYGLYADSDNDVIADNSFEDNGGAGATSSIYVSAPGVLVSGNRIQDNAGTGYAIEIAASASGVSLSNNSYSGAGANSISDLASDTSYTESNRITVNTDSSEGYNLLNITGSTTATATAITQLGTGDIFTLNNASSRVLTVNNSGNVGIGSSSPSSKLTIQGTAGASAFRVASSTGATDFLVNQYGDVEVTNGLYNAGIKWKARSAATASTWEAIAYGNGLFVALAYSGANQVMTSPDGINWTSRTATESNGWESIAYGNGLFVAISANGTNRIMTSPDGITWTARAAPEANGWYAITFGNGLFVAIANSGTNRVMTSPDGIIWTARAAAQANTWYDITYGNGLFVAVSDNGTNRVMTSPDGITWTPRVATEANAWKNITYGNGLFVAVSYNGTNRVMTSPDGINWTARVAAEANSWYTLTYGNGLFVAVSQSGTNRVMTSPNGINWTARAATEANAWNSIAYGNGLFVAISSNGTNRVMTSGSLTETILDNRNLYQGGMSVLGGAFNIGTTTPVTSAFYNNILNIASTTGEILLTLDQSGNLGIGTSSPSAKLSIDSSQFSGAGVVGLDQYLQTENSVESAIQYGNRFYLNASNTATTTIVGSMYRLQDDTQFENTVRGLEVQTNRGVNTLGENSALSGFARTFGVRGVTTGDAGGTYEPAGGFFASEGTTQGNAIRGYSDTITTATLLSLFQDSSDFTGTGLEMNFGNTTGDFASTSSKYLDFQNAGVSVFTVSAFGTTTIGDGTMNNLAGLQIGYGGICIDNDGTCVVSTAGRINSVSQATGNSDLAEMYFSNTKLETGEIVTLVGGLSIDRAHQDSTTPIIGVVSTKPGLTLGFDDVSLNEAEKGYPIALAGRVPVKLSTENGPIKKGDQLMLSSLPGVAMKAKGVGLVIGTALEDFNDNRMYSETFINQFGDDMVDPVYIPIFTNTDSRINDGCYYSGGGAMGDEPCVPLTSTSSVGQVAEANKILEAESVQEALDELRRKKSDKKYLPDGTSVKVGQLIMFVRLSQRWADEVQLASLGVLVGTSSLETIGDNENETVFDRLVSLANSFIDGVLSVFEIKASRIEVEDELCIDGVCIDGDDLLNLINAQAVTSDGVIEDVEEEPEDDDVWEEPVDAEPDGLPTDDGTSSTTATSSEATVVDDVSSSSSSTDMFDTDDEQDGGDLEVDQEQETEIIEVETEQVEDLESVIDVSDEDDASSIEGIEPAEDL